MGAQPVPKAAAALARVREGFGRQGRMMLGVLAGGRARNDAARHRREPSRKGLLKLAWLQAPAKADVARRRAKGDSLRAVLKKGSTAAPRSEEGLSRPPGRARALAEAMLIEGASPDEVVAAARRRGLLGLNRSTVERWLVNDPKLRERLIRRRVETVGKLRRSLERGRTSPDARLAEAALFAGLAPLRRGSSAAIVHDLARLQSALWEELGRENTDLQREARALTARKRSITRRLQRAQRRLERIRWELVRRRLVSLGRTLEGNGRRRTLGPRLIQTLRTVCRIAAGGRALRKAVSSRR